jgi:glycosyltransferase involved in cell wall biosynthesis
VPDVPTSELKPKPGRPRVLYVVYWGALEPLGQSLVVPGVTRLAELGADLTLVTFEKPTDTSKREALEDVRGKLRSHGIRWIALGYHKRPQLVAKPWDVVNGVARGLGTRLRGQIDIVHARTFLGGVMGLLTAPLLGAKLIFHNEGFYTEEQVDSGAWQEGSLLLRVARSMERQLYRRADALIVLSHRAREAVAWPRIARSAPVIVVPSAVDLDRFRLMAFPREGNLQPIRLVYAGAIGPRYAFRDAARFAAVVRRMTGGVRLRVLSRTEPAVIRELVEPSGLDAANWSLASVTHSDMPGELIRHHAGLSFLVPGASGEGGSPTKIGEYWASGLPVVTTPNAGDVDEIIRREHVGVVLADHTDQVHEAGVRELLLLLEDTSTPERCRRAAETHYSLEAACRRQMELYSALTPSVAEK